MSGSFESALWKAFVHRLDLGLYSHPKEFWGNGVRTHVNSKGKIPSPGKKFSSEEDRTRDTASSTINELFRPPLVDHIWSLSRSISMQERNLN